MTIAMSELTTPAFVRSLTNLKAALQKAETHAVQNDINAETLPNARLYPNMSPLLKQVHIACDTAKFAVARLSGQAAPSHDDTEQSFAELSQRIEDTIAYIQSVPTEALDGTENKAIEVKLPRMTLNLTGLDYITKFALPNFYFHCTTAHGILRHNGVDVGKLDYLAGIQ